MLAKKGVRISTKLTLVTVVTCAAFVCIVGTMLYVFGNIQRTVPVIIDYHMHQVVANGQVARRLTNIFAEIDLFRHTVNEDAAHIEKQKTEIMDRLERTIIQCESVHLQRELGKLREQLTLFFDQIAQINTILQQKKRFLNNAFAGIDALDVLFGELAVTIGPEREGASFIDQQLALVPMYREDLFYAEKLFSEYAHEYYMAGNGTHEARLFEIVDDLVLSLRTIPASQPNIAASVKLLLREVQSYRKSLVDYFRAIKKLGMLSDDVKEFQHQIHALLQELDTENLAIAEEGSRKINGVMASSRTVILLLSGVLIVLLLFFTVSFTHRNINIPISTILRSITAFREGNFDMPLRLGRKDEWGQIEEALNNMATARAAAERLLKENEENTSITLDSIGDGVIATDVSGKIVRMNRVAEQLTGWTIAEARGVYLNEVFCIMSGITREQIKNPIEKVLASGKVIGLANNTVLIARNGTEYQITDSAAPIQNEQGEVKGVVLIFRDISEKYRIEQELHQAQKMDALGRLAGGVAHDFNNMLAAIMGFGDTLASRLANDPQGQKQARMVVEVAMRAADLAKRLLAFSRKGTTVKVAFNVHEMISQVREILERSIGKRITIKTELRAADSVIIGDPAQIQVALLNIALNARDAMPEGGVLCFTTENITFTEDSCRKLKTVRFPGDYIEIDVSDTGVGMDKELQKRIFEPFFTTKEVGKGTGLGLSAVYGTVTEHHGCIHVYSEPQKGTILKIYLPVTAAAATMTEREAASSSLLEGSGCVLVIDDEFVIQEMVQAVLEETGYTVLCAASGADGIALYEREQSRINVVVLDLVMPDMEGRDVFYRLREINPAVKVLISSGFTKDTNVVKLIEDGAIGFIQKPYRQQELLSKIAMGMM